MEKEELRLPMSDAPELPGRRNWLKPLLLVVLALFALYSDILGFKVPFFGYIVCPLIAFFLAVVLLIKRTGIRIALLQFLIGPPAILLVVSIGSPLLGELNDQWIRREIRDWGGELLQQKIETGSYPASETKFFHGYRAVFVNKEPIEPAVIHFDLFGQTRQSYAIASKIFQEEREI